jgi:hypothetical protein
VKSEAISTPFLTRYCMESSTRLFLSQGVHFRLAGGKVLRLRRDLIRLTEESVCRLNRKRSIVDVAVQNRKSADDEGANGCAPRY